jgi:hypothetical protein
MLPLGAFLERRSALRRETSHAKARRGIRSPSRLRVRPPTFARPGRADRDQVETGSAAWGMCVMGTVESGEGAVNDSPYSQDAVGGVICSAVGSGTW